MMSGELVLWIVFNIFVLGLLALDLAVFNRRPHEIKVREALLWSAIWTVLAFVFVLGVWLKMGTKSALEFTAGYLIERALSMDNLFVFILIFRYFAVPRRLEHKVLFWGIFGALVMRAGFIALGVTVIHAFHWIIYIFGVFLIFTGIRLAFEKDKEVNPERNPLLRLCRKLFPMTDSYSTGKFFVRKEGRRFATPLLIVLVAVETTDVVFAIDSIPAVLAITLDPFIVYTSNVFAILGLRALYFAIAGIMPYFHLLHYGLSVILVFTGLKMLLDQVFYIPAGWALAVVGGVLVLSVIASLVFPQVNRTDESGEHSA